MFLLLLSACIFDDIFAGTDIFDGTWLVMMDRDAKLSGDCARGDDTGDGGTYEYEGTQNLFVDIFSTADGGLVVDLGSVALIGSGEGTEMTAEWETTTSNEDISQTERYEIDGSLEAAELEGKYSYSSVDVDAGDSYSCTSTSRYTAVLTTTTDDEIAGN